MTVTVCHATSRRDTEASIPSRPPTLRPLGYQPRKQAEHARKRQIDRKRQDDPIRKLYSSARWRIARLHFMAAHPLCECDECRGQDPRHVTEVVNHRIPHKGDLALFWDPANWQGMSKAHHDAWTVRHDGGFGNTVTPMTARPGGTSKV